MPARLAHYPAVLLAAGLLTFPNLGGHALWDMDEGVNVGCTREMMEAGTWVVPTFNWQLRTAKPVLLYWAQRLAFRACGPDEWAARLPSALFGLGTVLLTYELGRRLFDPPTGLLAAVALASAVQFCVLSHAATPDAPLIFFTVLTFYLVWRGLEDGGRGWLVWPAAACGLAVLSKGPIGLALPGLTVLLYLGWNRELSRAADRRLVWGVLIWALVALPWYALVTSETRGEYLSKFLGHDNVSRFASPMEGHRGPPVYYPAAIVVLFAPWSACLGPTLWYALRERYRLQGTGYRLETRTADDVAGCNVAPVTGNSSRFLLCWVGVYLAFFSAAATKLPNYIGPVYPPLAVLTARFLVRWGRGEVSPPGWVTAAVVGGVSLTGVVTAVGLWAASGQAGLLPDGSRVFPGLERWAWAGLLPAAGAVAMARGVRRNDRWAAVRALAAAAVGWVGVMAAGPPVVIDQYKSAKVLARASGADRHDVDVRLGSVLYFPESLVFYAGRRVERLHSAEAVSDFLATHRPAVVFVPAGVWAGEVCGKVSTPWRVAARKYDYYRHAEVLAVTNASD